MASRLGTWTSIKALSILRVSSRELIVRPSDVTQIVVVGSGGPEKKMGGSVVERDFILSLRV